MILKIFTKLFLYLGLDNGAIVNINDICSLKSLPLATDRPISPAYASSKTALTTLTESLRLELAQNESNIKIIVSNFKSCIINIQLKNKLKFSIFIIPT